MALSAAALLLVMGSAVGIDEALWRGAHAAAVVSAVSSAVSDPGSIFAARSPGARGLGALWQTKPDRVASAQRALPGAPEERVLASLRERPPGPDLALDGARPGLIQTLPGPPGGLPSFSPTGASRAAPLAFSPAPGGGFPLPDSQLLAPGGPNAPGDNPPGDSPPGTPPTTTPIIPSTVSPVPEPAAWMLMNLALFGVGGALRWHRSRRRPAPGAVAGSNA